MHQHSDNIYGCFGFGFQSLSQVSRVVKESAAGFKLEDVRFEDSTADDGAELGEKGNVGSMPDQQYAPIWLQNDTGIPIRYWYHSDGREEIDREGKMSGEASGLALPGHVVAVRVERPALNPSNTNVQNWDDKMRMGHHKCHHLQVMLEGATRCSPPISMDNIGSFGFTAIFSSRRVAVEGESSNQGTGNSFGDDSEEGGTTIPLDVVCEVKKQRYSKRVSVRSKFQLFNSTSLPLEVRFNIPLALAPKILGPVFPGQSLPFPVHLAESGPISWRPFNSTYVWCEPISLANLKTKATSDRPGLQRSVVCPPASVRDDAFRSCITITEKGVELLGRGRKDADRSEEPSDGTGGVILTASGRCGVLGASSETGMGNECAFVERTIIISPPLAVENWLPCTTEIIFRNGAGAIVTELTATEGSVVSIYEVDVTQDLQLTLQPRGFMQSDSISLLRASAMTASQVQDDQGSKEVKVLTEVLNLRRKDNGAIVSLELEKWVDMNCGSRRISVVCRYWIYNCTRLSLAVIDGDAEPKGEKEHYLPPLQVVPQSDACYYRRSSRQTPASTSYHHQQKPKNNQKEFLLQRYLSDESKEKTEAWSDVTDSARERNRQAAGGVRRQVLPHSQGSTGGVNLKGWPQSRLWSGASIASTSHLAWPRTRGSGVTGKEAVGLAVSSSFGITGGNSSVAESRNSVMGSPDSSIESIATPATGLVKDAVTRIRRRSRTEKSLIGGALCVQPWIYGRTGPQELKIRVRVLASGGGAGTGVGLGLGAQFRSARGGPGKAKDRTDAGSLWSEPFTLEPFGGVSVVTICRKGSNGLYILAVAAGSTRGPCEQRTKTITFRPRFVFANTLSVDVLYKQQGTDTFFRLGAGQQCPFHWTDASRNLLVCLRFDEHGWDWSGGFALDQLGEIQLKMRQHSSREISMIRISIYTPQPSEKGTTYDSKGSAVGGVGTCLIVVSEDKTAFMPFRIDNFSAEMLRFHQQKCETVDDVLRPYNSCLYAWDEPCRPHRLVLEIVGKGREGG
ncbi:hypothetical protein CBR_g47049 [Chara braunii]|uniref:Vacuolar protein sorting-associated protein 13 VPS13 adaptor binding domain-containing protein n=1 Tax=Chara braunii TaxID=69332 RepID=A0A388M1D0_CHABU|nr:hypothetical protein CBR_g47049 [Chara braunii]|eukprot:GBG88351.1 hypothetical protein CBR_g47049 [Chara braunii]